ncbi:hypothetical protein [Salegentibacter holothuriorum]|uniref:hypothetical protein n=1 Tax=Salegentibacter holothuriorum TaxID=241145 RepID=UPI0009A721ED|nr:hypothetical protein [Salegentibacter holothuriorum]
MKLLKSNLSPQTIATHICMFALMVYILNSCEEKKEKNIEKDFIAQTPKAKKFSKKEYEDRGKYLVEIIGCHDCHSPKKIGAKGPEAISELAFSGYQANKNLPELNKETLEKGWMLMNSDLTAFIGPW